jgi:hypothetical protein
LGGALGLQQEFGGDAKSNGLGMFAKGGLADGAGDLGNLDRAVTQRCQPLLEPRPFGRTSNQAAS